MKLDIKPQDKTELVALTVERMHPHLIKRLEQYAESLGGSDISYVLSQILDQVLPALKAEKADKPEPEKPERGKAKKTAITEEASA